MSFRVFSAAPDVLELYLNQSNYAIYFFDDIIKSHGDLERLTEESFFETDDHIAKEKSGVCVCATAGFHLIKRRELIL